MRIASAEVGGRFFVWDVSTGEWVTSPRLLPPGGGSVFWNPASTLIATTVAGGEYATIWDAATGEILYETLPGHEEPTSGVAWSPDGSQIATGGLDDTIRIYDTTTWAEVAVLDHPDSVYWVAWSMDGAMLAGGLRNGAIHLWDAQSRELLRVLERHPAAVERVVWSPDSRMVASSGDDATIRFWNVATGEQLESVQSTEGAIVDIAWSPDGTRLAYVGEQSDLPEIITPPQMPAAIHPDEARIVAVEAIPAEVADGITSRYGMTA
jgi:WD40 repeat protein